MTVPVEQIKDDAIIAALGDRTYPFGLEIGASEGRLSERLARRCGRLITLEPDSAAVRRARERLAAIPNVDVRLGSAPDDLPEWRFDLVVCSRGFESLDAIEARMPRAGTLLVVSPRGGEILAELAKRPGLVRVRREVHEDALIERFERR